MTAEGIERERAAALRWAGDARRAREQVRVELSSGAVDLATLLARRSEPLVGRVRLLWALESVPGARKIDTRRRLAAMGVDPSAPLDSLDDDTAAHLVDVFASPEGKAS